MLFLVKFVFGDHWQVCRFIYSMKTLCISKHKHRLRTNSLFCISKWNGFWFVRCYTINSFILCILFISCRYQVSIDSKPISALGVVSYSCWPSPYLMIWLEVEDMCLLLYPNWWTKLRKQYPSDPMPIDSKLKYIFDHNELLCKRSPSPKCPDKSKKNDGGSPVWR